MGAINDDDDEEDDDDDDDDESDDAGGPPLRFSYSYSHSCPGSRGRLTPKWPTPHSCP